MNNVSVRKTAPCRIAAAVRRILALTAPCALLACTASLPGPEAAAFRTLADANKQAFEGATAAERDAAVAFAAANLESGRGELIPVSCGEGEVGPCVLEYRNGGAVKLVEVAPNTRALIGAIANYGARMAELAEAEDLEAVHSQAEAAGGAVKGLAKAAGLPTISDPIVDAALFAMRRNIVARRRAVLLAAATAAHPAIEAAARSLSPIAGGLKANLVRLRASNLRAYDLKVAARFGEEERLTRQVARLQARADRGDAAAVAALALASDRLDRVRERRLDEVTTMLRSADGINDACAMRTDFSGLARAHATLIRTLEDPRVSAEDALADLNEFVTILDGMSAASGGGE